MNLQCHDPPRPFDQPIPKRRRATTTTDEATVPDVVPERKRVPDPLLDNATGKLTEEDKRLLTDRDVEPQVPIAQSFISCCAIVLEAHVLEHEWERWLGEGDDLLPDGSAESLLSVRSPHPRRDLKPIVNHPDQEQVTIVVTSAPNHSRAFIQHHTPAALAPLPQWTGHR